MFLKNVSLGIYYPGTSLLHRLQARTKLLVIVCFIFGLALDQFLFVGNFAPYLVALALTLIGVAVSGISPRELARRMWLLTLIVLLSTLLALLIPAGVTYAGQPIYILPPLMFTLAFLLGLGLVLASLVTIYLLLTRLPVPALRHPCLQHLLKRARTVAVWLALILGTTTFHMYFAQPPYPTPRLAYMITDQTRWTAGIFIMLYLVLYSSSLLLTMTTSPMALIEGITMLLKPLRWLRLPVDDFALMLLIALRFIPTLFEEIEQLIKAQVARGASFNSGTLRERIQSVLALFSTFLRNTLRRASDLSIALDARGYQVEGRQTRLYEKRLAWTDYLVLLLVSGSLLAALFLPGRI